MTVSKSLPTGLLLCVRRRRLRCANTALDMWPSNSGYGAPTTRDGTSVGQARVKGRSSYDYRKVRESRVMLQGERQE